MRISLLAPAAALLGLFAITAQAAPMTDSPDNHNAHVQVHKAPQHKVVVKKRAVPQHKAPVRKAQPHRAQASHDAPANR